MENTNINIPSTTVSGFTKVLAEIYAGAVSSGADLKALPTPFLWGPPGVGKSEGVRQLAELLEQKTGKSVRVTDVRLLLFSPVDLRGVPVADRNREFTNWLRPRLFAMDGSREVINLLFLDELSAAPQSVQAAAYQICLDRTVGEHRLPDNCIVIAAGNRTTDRSVSYKMPKALCNRLMHLLIEPDYTEWKHWALHHGIDERIIGYLAFDNSRLCAEPENSDLAYPTPRSWSFVSSLLNTPCSGPKNAHLLIASCVGTDTALSFEEWCRIYNDLPSVEDILKGRCRRYPKRHDALFALVASLTAALFHRRENVTDSEIHNVCAYSLRFPPDFAVTLFSDLNRSETLRLKLMGCRLFGDWLRKNKDFIIS